MNNSMNGIYVFWREGSEQAEYVGSSTKVSRRIVDHICELRKGKHANPHLQNAWNKYGEASYHAIQIETCPDNILIEREQHWMNTLKPCRNIAVCSDSPMRGRKTSPEARAKQSAAKKGKHISDEHRANIGAAIRGAKHHAFGKHLSAEHRAKLSASHCGSKNHNFGKTFSAEHRDKLSASHRGSKNYNFGKHLSAEHRAKISAAMKLRRRIK